MAQRQIPGPPRTSVQGSLEAVPCPHCGGRNDLRDMQAQQLLDTGHCFYCDHCQRSMEVIAIRPVTLVAVRKYEGPMTTIGPGGTLVRRAQPAPQPKPGGLLSGFKKLLGGPK